MGKYIFTITYEIKPDKREDYLQLARIMKQSLAGNQGKNYSIYEHRGKKNTFSEIFICNTKEEYDKLEDDNDEQVEKLIEKLDEYLVDNKMKYSTLIEIE